MRICLLIRSLRYLSLKNNYIYINIQGSFYKRELLFKYKNYFLGTYPKTHRLFLMLNALVKFTILKRGVIGLKKIISVILAAAMAVTLMLPAMASTATSTDMGLENAIKSVKERIDIPKEFTKFSYDISNYGNQNSWRLTWSEEKANNNISVTIDENNMIRYYYSYNDSTSYDKKIPKYSEEQGLQIAEKFINKLDSKLLQQFKRVKATDYNSFDNNYN